VGEFTAWARQPAPNVVVLHEQAALRSAKTVNRMLASIVGFYEFHGRRGNSLAQDLVVKTRYGFGGYKPFLSGIASKRPRGRAVRLPEEQRLPRTLSLEQVAAIIDVQRRLRDRFFFALLASTGMRVGQALALRHEDIVSWERRIVIEPRPDAPARARSKNNARGCVPVTGELIRLWNDYMHLEYRDLDADFVFVTLWGGEPGRPLTYATIDDLVRRTRRAVGFHFTPHLLRHTYATLAYRDGVALEVIGALLTHRSPSSTLAYAHPTVEDLRRALAERGVLKRVEDLIA
jgi:integrase